MSTPSTPTPSARKSSVAKKPASRKPAGKKPAAKKPAARKSRTTTKTPASKQAQKQSQKQSTAAVMQADLKKLEARLKRADTITRKSVTALETIVSTLDARVSTGTKDNRIALSQYVNALSRRLDDQVEETRALVRAELKAALSAGGLDTLGAAIASARARMDAAELAQADAVTKINRHLADMARAVDARIAQEASDRARDIAGVQERLMTARLELDGRVDGVERDSADALTRVGDSIADIKERLDARRSSDADALTSKINDLALQTQAELEAYQARLDTRIAQLEMTRPPEPFVDVDLVTTQAAEAAQARVAHQLDAMQTRIDELERDRARAAYEAAQARAVIHAPAALDPVYIHQEQPAPAAVQASMPAQAQAQPANENPYAAKLSPEDRPGHVPMEFDPSAYAAQTQPHIPPQSPQHANVLAFAPPPPPIPAAQPPIESLRPSVSVPQPVSGPPPGLAPIPSAPLPGLSAPTLPPSGPMEPDFEPAPLPSAPFANPAYAEGGPPASDGSPVAVRIGGSEKSARKAEKAARKAEAKRAKAQAKAAAAQDKALAPITSPDAPLRGAFTARNAKLGALMVGVAAVGLFAFKGILDTGGPIESPQAPNVFAPTGEARADAQAGVSIPDDIANTTAPIGQYEEATLVSIDPSSLGTLDAAAAAGDPIAMTHKGLNLMEAGDTEQAIDLLRRAANADQPAALYRLAKIYEEGEALPKDETIAKDLIERAARGGNRIAMHDLALYYYYGQGDTPQDLQTARSWFEQAATRGVVDSQFNLAILFESTDSSLPQNPDEAFFWYSIAAAQGDQLAVDRRDALAMELETDRVQRVEERVRTFTPRAIDKVANGVFTGQPWTKKPKSRSSGSETVRTAQTLLAGLGFEVGTPDGLMGKRTRTAIQAFERDNGLPETGEVGPELIERLQLASGA